VEYVLALCEGNLCGADDEGEIGGGGRIHVLRRGGDHWNAESVIHIPPAVRFKDYAAIALAGNWVVVVSQQASALWVGRLHETEWEFVDDGEFYSFPRDSRGDKIYCYIEGVDWIDAKTFVVVSDAGKDGASNTCAEANQSLHVFSRPTA
jgi:hypothetical protein